MKNYAMKDKSSCTAPNRPPYCMYKTNKCCFSCTLLKECRATAIAEKEKILPCTSDIFDEGEVCSFAS